MRIRFLSPINDKWSFLIPLWNSNEHCTVYVGIDRKHPEIIFMGSRSSDNSEFEKNVKLNWKEEFATHPEIVFVVRKCEVREDDDNIKLEANLIVNKKRVERFEYSCPKSGEVGRGLNEASLNAIMCSHMEKGESDDFLFEVSDLRDESY